MNSIELSNFIMENYQNTSQNKRSFVCGVGINDANYTTQPRVNGGRLNCPAYVCWKHMLSRCYTNGYKTYVGVTVCEEWLIFSNFRKWWVSNSVDGWELDKDLLVVGNKIYSPKTCLFVPPWLNSFLNDRRSVRSKHGIGVTPHNKSGLFRARCNNRLIGTSETIGLFKSELEAKNAWKNRKIEIITSMKDEVDDINGLIFENIVKIIEAH